MSGIVVYSEYEAKRNEFAVSKFKKYLGAELVTAENLQISAKHDFVINRTNNAKIARGFENLGVRVFNPSPLTALANDKQACYEFMQSNGIEIMPVNQTAAPVVEKPANGKGGQGVRLIKSGEFKIKPGFVYQKPASDLGRDLRVWLIGGEIICAVLRQSDSDFRSNFASAARLCRMNCRCQSKHLCLKSPRCLNLIISASILCLTAAKSCLTKLRIRLAQEWFMKKRILIFCACIAII